FVLSAITRRSHASACASRSRGRNADGTASLHEPPRAAREFRQSCSPSCLIFVAPLSRLRLDAEIAPRHERELRDTLRTVCGAARSLDGKGEGQLLGDRVDDEVKTFPRDKGAVEHRPLPQALMQLLGGVDVDPLYLR